KNQDWPTWVQEGWVDLTVPMAYYRDSEAVESAVFSMIELVNGMSLNYAGVAPSYIGLESIENVTHTEAARLGQAQGSSIFASQNILGLEDVKGGLQEGTYRNKAV